MEEIDADSTEPIIQEMIKFLGTLRKGRLEPNRHTPYFGDELRKKFTGISYELRHQAIQRYVTRGLKRKRGRAEGVHEVFKPRPVKGRVLADQYSGEPREGRHR